MTYLDPTCKASFNPLGPKSDQHQIFPDENYLSDHQKENAFSQLFLKEMYGDKCGEFVCGYWRLKG